MENGYFYCFAESEKYINPGRMHSRSIGKRPQRTGEDKIQKKFSVKKDLYIIYRNYKEDNDSHKAE